MKLGTNTGGTFDVEWMKLEIGDHATPYVPRLYAEELELCRRYYREVRFITANVYAVGKDTIRFAVSTEGMRSNPTANLTDLGISKNNDTVTGFAFVYTNYPNVMLIYCDKASHGLTYSDCISGSGTLKLDAEL